MSPLRIWLMAARPRTLPAAVAPVLVGTALAATEGTFKVPTFGPVWPKRALSAAIERSQTMWRTCPPPTA